MSAITLREIKAPGGRLKAGTWFSYSKGECSYHCRRPVAVETNDCFYSGGSHDVGATYDLCAYHARLVGRRRWTKSDEVFCQPRIWRWVTTNMTADSGAV